MNKVVWIIMFFCIAFVPGVAQKTVQMKNIPDFKSKLKEASAKTATVTADFKQFKTLSLLAETVVSKGKFYFKKDNRIRWEYTSPFHYIIVIDGGELKIKDGDKVTTHSSSSNKMFESISSIMSGAVQGKLLDGDKRFTAAFFEDDKHFIAELTPNEKSMKAMLAKIIMYFDKKGFSVSKILMEESSGDNTLIEFSNKKLNEQIPDNIFNLR